jgi:CheY-like chemotaxis protein
MGGHIRATNAPGRGAVFEVLLPAYGAAVAAVAPPAPPDRAAVPASAPQIRRTTRGVVLVVDDHPQVVRATERLLLRAGYEVICANAPEGALEVLAHGRAVDLLLTDVVMPTMSGHALAERVRESRPELPILYMSGHSSDGDVQRDLDEGRARFLRKPFDQRALVAEVEQALAKAS